MINPVVLIKGIWVNFKKLLRQRGVAVIVVLLILVFIAHSRFNLKPSFFGNIFQATKNPVNLAGTNDFNNTRGDSENNSFRPEYEPGVFLVSFKTEKGSLIDKNLSSANLKLSSTKTGLATINALNAKYNVKAIAPVFKALKTKQLQTGKSSEQIYEEIKIKFPNRSKRIPKNEKLPNLLNVYKFELADKKIDVVALCAEYKRDFNVAYCQPNYIIRSYFVPNDPYYNSSGSWGQPPARGDYQDLWGLKKIQAEDAWDLTQGAGITVAVVDTGVDYTHPDIGGNIWINLGEIPDNGFDDDENGYIDDGKGWDFALSDNDPADEFGHGTHVAGTIAAIGNNGIGVIGVAPQAKIMAVKGLNERGAGTIDNLAAGILYAAMNGADVINNSWGCPSACPNNPIGENAVQAAHGLGVVVVFAAGNSTEDVISRSPQNMIDPKPVVVAASNFEDSPVFFSNFGNLIDVSAPGGGTTSSPPSFDPERNILSLKSANCNIGMCPSALIVGSNYLRQAGTSMSAPHVAGLAALILAYQPTFTNEGVRQVIRASADDVGSYGFDFKSGAGRINATRALVIESVPNVKINNPIFNGTLTQESTVINIQGTANGSGFQNYELFYGSGLLPAEWISLTGLISSPVENGILGSWSVQNLADNPYLLKLVVTTQSGFKFQEVVQVSLEKFPPRRITASLADEWYPAVSGNRIVWEDYRNGNADIYLYDLDNGIERQITIDSSDQKKPRIYNDLIVWEDMRNGNNDIYLFDLAADIERQITTDPSDQTSPDISGNKIVWEDYRNGNADIYFYNISLGSEWRITTNTYDQRFPVISQDQVVWEDYSNGGIPDIHLYDLVTATERAVNPTPWLPYERKPFISGNKIVWEDIRNQNYDIYFYDLDAESGQLIVTADGDQKRPKISGELVVWYDLRSGNSDIYLYDLATNLERRLIFNPAEQRYPFIADNKIVWQDTRNGNYDIYLYDLSRLPNLSVSPVNNFNSIGPRGGPFSPSFVNFVLTNAGGEVLDWAINADKNWLSVSPRNGSLMPGNSINVGVLINSNANNLNPGVYIATINFTNMSNNFGNAIRSIKLIVRQPKIFPIEPLGEQGGIGTFLKKLFIKILE